MVGFTTLARRLPRGREHHGGFGKQLHSRSLQCAHYHPQRSVTARARGRGGNSPDDQQEESKPDIDLLAKMLSQQAAKLRASLEEEESPEGFVDAPRDMGAGVLAQVGSGGFDANEFEVVQQLGRLTFQQEVSSFDEAGAVGPSSSPSVYVYAARYTTGLPFQAPLTTLVKEYSPAARAVALNELLILSHLCGLPSDKWLAANGVPRAVPPIVPPLGFFVAPSSDEPEDAPGSTAGDALWLVYKWERLKPLGLLLASGPPKPAATLFIWNKSKADEDAWRARRNFVRATARGLLAALDYCHSRGVTHGSLSAGSVMLSTLEDQDYDDLVVKLDNFGFGRRFGGGKGSSSSSSSTDADFRAALREDLRAAALLLLETCFAGLKTTQPQAAVEAAAAATGEEWWGDDGTASSSMDAAALNTPASTAILARATLKRLLFDVCRQDVGRLREFCARDASLAKLVEFMDDARGWDCLRELLAGSRGAGELLREGEYFR